MGSLEGTQVCQHRPTVTRADLDHAVRHRRDAMRAACSGEEPVQLVPDEGDAGDAADQIAERGAGLARRQLVHHGRDRTCGTDLRDSATEHRIAGAAEIRSGRSRNRRAASRRRIRAAETALGDVEIAVGAECQPAWIVETGREDACHSCRMFLPVARGRPFAGCLDAGYERHEHGGRREKEITPHDLPFR